MSFILVFYGASIYNLFCRIKLDGDVPLVKPRKERNAKRGRMQVLIKERAEKKRLLDLEQNNLNSNKPPSFLGNQTNEEYGTEWQSPPLINLTPSDHRYFISKIFMEAMNTCDIAILEDCFRKYCSNDLICSALYVGELEHNPLGPNSRVFIGIDVIVGETHLLVFLSSGIF